MAKKHINWAVKEKKAQILCVLTQKWTIFRDVSESLGYDTNQ